MASIREMLAELTKQAQQRAASLQSFLSLKGWEPERTHFDVERCHFQTIADGMETLLRDIDAQGADQGGVLQDDLRELLWLLGLPDGARPASPHEVFQQALGVLRQRLDAQGAAPAGPPVITPFHESFDAHDWAKAFIETAEKLGHRGIDEGWMIGWFANALMRGYDFARAKYERPAPPSPALHAPTVEACARLIERCHHNNWMCSAEDAHNMRKAHAAALRALTSGAEAGERACTCHPDDRPPGPCRKKYALSECVADADRGASAEPRPLSEWSDEELFRHGGLSGEVTRPVLFSRGYRPWHGGDRAPAEVQSFVPVWFKGGFGGKADQFSIGWKRTGRCTDADIIAYRPVPAKAEPTTERQRIESRIAKLEADNEATSGWGAAVGARQEEINGLRKQLAPMRAPRPGRRCWREEQVERAELPSAEVIAGALHTLINSHPNPYSKGAADSFARAILAQPAPQEGK